MTNTKMDYVNQLTSKFNILIEQGTCSEKYCHLKSVVNFINSFDMIRGSEKERIFFLLSNYMEIIKSEPAVGANNSLELFNEFIRPIGKYYEDELSFMPMINLWVISFWIICLFIFIYVLHLAVWVYIAVGLPILIYYLYVFKKRLDKKVYGFMF